MNGRLIFFPEKRDEMKQRDEEFSTSSLWYVSTAFPAAGVLITVLIQNCDGKLFRKYELPLNSKFLHRTTVPRNDVRNQTKAEKKKKKKPFYWRKTHQIISVKPL